MMMMMTMKMSGKKGTRMMTLLIVRTVLMRIVVQVALMEAIR